MNYRFGTTMEAVIDNTGNNSDIAFWLALAPADARSVKVFVVIAGEKKTVRMPRFGNLEKTFLMVANLSAVNKAVYSIAITGLRREKKQKPASKKTDKENMEVA